jgi:hypothetical protein
MVIEALMQRSGEAAEPIRRLPADNPATIDNRNGTLVLITLMYVSTSRLDPATATKAVETIVAGSRLGNQAAGITGALLFTGTHFVQVLEGDSAAIDALMTKLRADSRHENLIIANRALLRDRKFADWDLVYSGVAHFVRRRVIPLLDKDDPVAQRSAALALTDIMYQFTKR